MRRGQGEELDVRFRNWGPKFGVGGNVFAWFVPKQQVGNTKKEGIK
jgi:hypothetical protein